MDELNSIYIKQKQNMKYLYLAILLAVIGTSCQKKQSNNLFKDSVVLKSKRTVILNKATFIWGISAIDSLLLVQDNNDANASLKIFSLNDFKLKLQYGPRGRGPGELINPSCIFADQKNKLAWIESTPPNKIYGYPLDRQKKEFVNKYKIKAKLPVNNPAIFYAIISDTSYAVSHNAYGADITTYNFNGKKIKSYGNGYDKRYKMNDYAYNFYYIRNIAYDNVDNVIYSAYLNHDILTRCDLNTGKYKIYKFPNYEIPIPQANDGKQPGQPEYMSFRHIVFCNNHLFVSYLGGNSWNEKENVEIFPKSILIFNTNLEPVNKIVFDKGIRCFTVTNNGELIIADENQANELTIYDINFLLK